MARSAQRRGCSIGNRTIAALNQHLRQFIQSLRDHAENDREKTPLHANPTSIARQVDDQVGLVELFLKAAAQAGCATHATDREKWADVVVGIIRGRNAHSVWIEASS